MSNATIPHDMKEVSPGTSLGGILDLSSPRANREIKPFALDRIDVPAWARHVDPDTVNELYESIKRNGLLQPIGVRRNPDNSGRVTLLWGRHRLEAFRKGYQLHFPEQGSWISIPAVFYADDLTIEDAEIMSIIENLQRHELKADERDVQRLRLGGLLKAKGGSKDISSSEQRTIAGKASGASRQKANGTGGTKPLNEGTSGSPVKPLAEKEKPTTAEAVAAITGITPKQARQSVAKTLGKAREADPTFDPDKKLNIATATPEQMAKAADLAEEQIVKDRAAEKARPKPAAAARPKPTDVVPVVIYDMIDRAYRQGGEAIFKLAVNKLWTKHHKDGRVVFNVDYGPGD